MTREEAILVVKTTKDWSELREALAVLVPELAESEDDKAERLILDLPFKHEADYKFVKDWFEKKKELLTPEEDEKIRKELIDILEKSYKFGGFTLNNKKDLDRYLAYLKRHKEQEEHWKPSEEQMVVLFNAERLVRANNYTENARTLAGLYDDLKKL